MLKGIKFFSLILLIFVLSSCDSNKHTTKSTDSRIVVKSGDLEGRVSIVNKPIRLVEINSNRQNLEREVQDFSMMLRAEVDAPEFEGNILRATHVKIKDNLAFVTYNTEGNTFLGGLDIFDVSNIEFPQLVTQAYFINTDIASVDFDNNNIYLAEHTDIYSDENFQTGAVIEKLAFSNNELTSLERIDLPSFAANSVVINNDKIHVTSGNGNDGGLVTLAKGDLSLLNFVQFEDARYVDINENYLVALKGTPAELKSFDINSGDELATYSVNGANIVESKSTLDLIDEFAFVAAGDEGLKVINLNNGEEIDSIERPDTIPGGYPGDYVTNGVSVNDDNLVLVANGAAGVYVTKWNGTQLNILGTMDFNSSTNFVASEGNKIFVATGFGGLKIIEYSLIESGTVNLSLTNSDTNLIEPGVNILLGDELIGTTDADGSFSYELTEGFYNLELEKDGFVTSAIQIEIIGDEVVSYSPEITPIVQLYGIFSGSVKNALSAELEPEVTISTAEESFVSDSEGNFNFQLPVGQHIITISKEEFIPYTIEVVITEETEVNHFGALSPILDDGQLRFVLSWKEVPEDLDCHVLTPVIGSSNYHVYYRSMGRMNRAPYIKLNVDDRVEYGPETVTFYELRDGTYNFFVHSYTGESFIGNEATIRVYSGNQLTHTFELPQTGEGRYWHVANIDGNSGEIIPLNYIDNDNYRSIIIEKK